MPHMNPIAFDNPYFSMSIEHRLYRGITGYTIEKGREIIIPVIHSHIEGKGYAGQYIDSLKEKYDIITFPNVLNSKLAGMLERRGFQFSVEYIPELRSHTDVYKWVRDDKKERTA